MHTHLHRTPQPNTFPSFTPNTHHAWYASHTEPTVIRLGYVVSPTHVPRYAHCVIHPHRYPYSHLSSFAVLSTPSPKIIPTSNAPPPRSYATRRYPGPLYVTPTPFTIQHRSHVQVSLVCLSHPLRPDFRLHTPSPAPRPHRPPASGRRVSSHLFPRAYLQVPVI